ncbi:MAG: hypothetical protein JW854_06830 [Actinobacteria bacterium]|nr:hypothetical protein [Actinomycetota bacterium]
MFKKVLLFIIMIAFCLPEGFIGCGRSSRLVENDYIAFRLSSEFDNLMLNIAEEESGLPLNEQPRVVIWDKEYPNRDLIYIYYPSTIDGLDVTDETSRRTVNNTEVIYYDDGGFYTQIFLDKTMPVSIVAINDSAAKSEADNIIESLNVKKGYEEQ